MNDNSLEDQIVASIKEFNKAQVKKGKFVPKCLGINITYQDGSSKYTELSPGHKKMRLVMKKFFMFPIMVLCIPLDFIGWNLIFGMEYGYRSFKKCAGDGWKLWKKL